MNEVIEHEVQSVAQVAPASDSSALMQIISRAASDPAYDVAKLQSLLALKKEWEADEARKAFKAAMARFKTHAPELTKNKKVGFDTSKGRTEYSHATLDEVALKVGKELAIEQLTHDWRIQQLENGSVQVTCVITHALGHSEEVSMSAPPDTSGTKNSIQSMGSTITYLERYTLLAVTGMAVKGQDDDGNGASKEGLSQEDFDAYVKRIKEQTKKADARKVCNEAIRKCAELQDVESANKIKAELTAHEQFIDNADKEVK